MKLLEFIQTSRAFLKVKCPEIFTPVITDTGVCCAFNGHVSFVESQYSELVKEMQVIDLSFFLILFLFLSDPVKVRP